MNWVYLALTTFLMSWAILLMVDSRSHSDKGVAIFQQVLSMTIIYVALFTMWKVGVWYAS